MENNILIAGSCTTRGIKVSKFLQRKGFDIFGVDRHHATELFVKKFFRMDMRHQDNMELVMTIVKPSVVIFCPEKVTPTYNSYISFSGVLGAALNAGVSNIALCLDQVYDMPKDANEIAQLSMYHLLNVYKASHNLNTLVITDSSNLLKEIKIFVQPKGTEDGENNI